MRRGTVRTNTPIESNGSVIHVVIVGGAQSLFVPNLIRAKVGDYIQCQFAEGNHTFTRGAENAGCEPLQKTVPDAVHSGHIPFLQGQKDVGTFLMPVTSEEPECFYCATGPHCQIGQVMCINASVHHRSPVPRREES